MVRIGEVISVIERAYPLRLAESWDTGIGLTCGDQDEPVTRVLLAVDVDPVTVAQAIDLGAELLLTHHPLLFRPVQSIAAHTPRGALVHRLIRAGIAHYAAHTNADRAVGGVNDALAGTLGLTDLRPIVGADQGDPAEGIGRIGRLPTPMTLAQFSQTVANALPGTAGGVRAGAGSDHSDWIEWVAVCGGSGGSLLPEVAHVDVQAYVTADLGHHVASEYLAVPGRPALVDVAHFASEWPWLNAAATVINTGMDGSVNTTVSTLRTDPWGSAVTNNNSILDQGD